MHKKHTTSGLVTPRACTVDWEMKDFTRYQQSDGNLFVTVSGSTPKSHRTISSWVISIVSVDGLVPYGAKPSTGAVKSKYSCMKQELEMLIKTCTIKPWQNNIFQLGDQHCVRRWFGTSWCQGICRSSEVQIYMCETGTWNVYQSTCTYWNLDKTILSSWVIMGASREDLSLFVMQ